MLAFSKDLRVFYRVPAGLRPDGSVISKFKITFVDEIRLFFEALTLPVIDIFDGYNESLPDNSPEKGKSETAVYDTTGLKPKVKENNPKFLQSEIKRQTNLKKSLESQVKGETFAPTWLPIKICLNTPMPMMLSNWVMPMATSVTSVNGLSTALLMFLLNVALF